MDQQTFVQVKPMTDSPSPKICLHILQSALPTRNLLTTWSLSAPQELQFIRAALIFYVVTDVGARRTIGRRASRTLLEYHRCK